MSRWVEKAPYNLGGNNRVRIIGQAGWHVETGTFEGTHANRNELLSCWPSTLVWLVSELRAAFLSGPGYRRHQEAFGLWTGRNSHVGLFCGVRGWNQSTDGPARACCLQGISVRVTFLGTTGPGSDHSQCSKWGKGGGSVARATVAVEAPLTMWGPGEVPWTWGPLGAKLMLPIWDRTLGSCAARWFVLSVY